jgi:hypothetical protein
MRKKGAKMKPMRIIGILLWTTCVALALGCGATSGEVLLPQSIDGGTADAPSTQPEASVVDAAPDAVVDAPQPEAVDAGCDGSIASDPDNCGACGHGCLGGACVAGQCQPVLLATGPQPFSVVVDDTRVYWTTAGTDPGEVRSVAKDGSSPATIATGLNDPQGVFVDATNLFWNEVGSPGRVSMGDKDGSNAVILSQSNADGPQGIVADTSWVYWLDIYTYRGVVRAGRTATPDGGTPTVLASGWDYVFGMAQDDTYIYWTSEGTAPVGDTDAAAAVPGKILSVRKDGTTSATVLADGLGDPHFVTVDATAVYWTDSADNTVMRLALKGSAPTQLAQGAQPYGIAVDATYVYFSTLGTDHSDGTLVRVPKDGSGPAVVLATGLSWPSQIAFDNEALYWGNSHGGTVMKLAK